MWKTPTPPEDIQTQKIEFAFLFLTWVLDVGWRGQDSNSTQVEFLIQWPSWPQMHEHVGKSREEHDS